MISLIEKLPAGNALRVHLSPLAGATKWRLLRSTAADIPVFNAPGALVVHEGSDEAVLDAQALANGVTYFYRPFYLVGGTWHAEAARSAVAEATFTDETPNEYLGLVCERLDLGLASLIERGRLKPPAGRIAVLTASPEFEGTDFPVVTAHLASDLSAERGIGEHLADDEPDGIGGVEEFEGWLARHQLTVISWCMNADTRAAMRRAVRSVVLANLAVFDAAGMVQIDVSLSDQDDMTSYPAPVYQSVCTLSFLAPELVGSTVRAITDVTVKAEAAR